MTTARHSLTVTRPYVLRGTVERCAPARGSHQVWPAHDLLVKIDRTSDDSVTSVVFVRASSAELAATDLPLGAHVTIWCNCAKATYPGQPWYGDVPYLLAFAIEAD